MRRRVAFLVVLVAALAAGVGAYARGWVPTGPVRDWWERLFPSAEVAVYSGTLEATRVQVMSQVPARVLEVLVDEGDEVSAGQVVIRLDDSLLQKQINMAAAGIELARGQLDLLKAGPRPEEREKAQAEVAAAQVALEVAEQALADAQAVYRAAQDVWPDIVQAETELAKVRHLRDAALAQAQAADIEADFWRRKAEAAYAGITIKLPTGQEQHIPTPTETFNAINYQWNLASQRQWQAWAQYQQAEAAVKAAEAALAAARSRLDDPARRQPVVEAQAALEEARAALQAAQERLAALDETVTPEMIEAAKRNLERAEAAYERYAAEQDLYTLTAPISGRVLDRAVEPGEVAVPGTPLLEIANLDTLRLTVYVPEAELGRFSVGQEVFVWVDAYPGRSFRGRVVRIADEAEFTPKNVQTREERTTLMFAVEIEVPNPDNALKPGMPADVTLRDVPPPPVAAESRGEELLFSGTLEARKVRVMPEVTARVASPAVKEGDHVTAGQVVMRLDPGPLKEQLREAEAALEAARARLAELQSRPVPAQVRVAQAALAQAQAAVAAAEERLGQAQATLGNPVELEGRIQTLRARIPLLEQQLEEARAQRKQAQVTRDYYEWDMSDEGRTRFAVAEKQMEAADARIRAIEAEIEGTRRLIDLLASIRRRPLALIAQVHRAEGELRIAQAQAAVAEKALALAQAPARREELAQAEAEVNRAQAALELVREQLARYEVRAPITGTVLSVALQAGEVAQAGAAAMEIADTSTLYVTLFVPEPMLGRLQLGQEVAVQVDAYPGRAFLGTIVWIADEAEFTPKNVQTRQDRAEMVFRVKVRVPNPGGLLKAGMPADVRIP